MAGSRPDRTALSNYAILVDRSQSMGSAFGDTTRLTGASRELLTAVEDDEEIARALWYFGGGCDSVSGEPNVELASGNASSLREGLENPPATQGDRPLIDAMVAAVSELATVSPDLGGDVSTDRRIVVFTDGPDTCGEDPTRVSTALTNSAIEVEFNIVGIDLDSAALEPLQQLARALPRAELIQVANPPDMEDVVDDVVGGDGSAPTTSTTSVSTSTISTTSTSTIPTSTPLTSTPPTSTPPTSTPPTTATRRRPTRA